MFVIDVHLSAAQQRKAQKGQAFQISASAMQSAPNSQNILNSKPKQSQFLRNKRNNKWFRLQEGGYKQMGQSGDDGGALVGELVASGDVLMLRKQVKKQRI